MSEMKKTSKVIVLERNRFALMVKNYRKSLHIINLLTHVCRDRQIGLTMTAQEVAEIFDMTVEEIRQHRDDGTLRYMERDEIYFYEASDVVRLKNSLEMAAIYVMINDASVLPQQLTKKMAAETI